jgi:hypothetical protein
VGGHYDELDAFYRYIWGEHLLHGLWTSGKETPEKAAPMVGGLFSATLLTLVVLPASYMLIQRYRHREQLRTRAGDGQPGPAEATEETVSTPGQV